MELRRVRRDKSQGRMRLLKRFINQFTLQVKEIIWDSVIATIDCHESLSNACIKSRSASDLPTRIVLSCVSAESVNCYRTCAVRDC